jgi:glycosyltransferase involved in cell wall biosynthesis
MTRVLIGTSSLVGAGIAAYTRELLHVLASHGHHVSLVAPVLPPEREWREWGVAAAWATPIGANEDEDRETCRILLTRIQNDPPEVLINSDNHFVATLWPAMPSSIRRIPVVHFPGGPIARDAMMNRDWVDKIVAISEDMARNLKSKYALPAEKVAVVYNTVREELPLVADWDSRFTSPGPLRVGFFGGDSSRKGALLIPKIIDALRRDDGIEVNIDWFGTSHTNTRFESRGALTITRSGPVPRSRVLEWLRNGHVLLMPSRGEACPMLLLEAMSCGVVPIVSDCPSAMRELVITGKNGAVVGLGDVNLIVGWVRQFVRDRVMLRRAARESRRCYDQNLAPEIFHARMSALWSGNFLRPRPGVAPFSSLKNFRWHRLPRSVFAKRLLEAMPAAVRARFASWRDHLEARSFI